MLVLRPAGESDLAALVALAGTTGGGLTSLPPHEEFLGDRIHESLRAFHPRVRRPGGESYLFVLEDTAEGSVIGVSGIASRVGGFHPWYSYEIRAERFVHPPLKVERSIPTLHLRQEHRGPTELCSLFLRADRRGGAAGRLLSLGRFLFIAGQPQRFTATIVAELRGRVDSDGKSPFWEAVGRNFFAFDFYAADVLSGLGEKEFIADLMPRHPIYIPLLPPAAQAVIGRVHAETEPAQALLRSEGFGPTAEVDIFDAGPQVRSTQAEIRTIRDAVVAEVREVDDALATAPATHLLGNGALAFRACVGAIAAIREGIVVAPGVAEALQVRPGDRIRHVPLRSNPATGSDHP